VADVKAEQQALADSQATLLKAMEDGFGEFRNAIRAELAALRGAISESLGGAPAPGQTAPPAAAEAPAEPPGPAVPEIRAAPAAPLDGLLAALGRALGGNPAARGGVAVAASSCLDAERFAPENAADPAGDANFVSQKQPDAWLRYDFKGGRVALTHYTVRSRSDGFPGSNNLRDWVVEVSDDAVRWIVVDSQKGNADLNGKGALKTFPVAAGPRESRFVRLRQTGPAHSGKDFLAICGFELFGSLTPSGK
jgi:hypothetical protein